MLPLLCFAMLCFALLCFSMQCLASPGYALLCCALRGSAMLCYALLCFGLHCMVQKRSKTWSHKCSKERSKKGPEQQCKPEKNVRAGLECKICLRVFVVVMCRLCCCHVSVYIFRCPRSRESFESLAASDPRVPKHGAMTDHDQNSGARTKMNVQTTMLYHCAL